MDVLLANPRGFCAGVDRAIEIVKRALETLGAPIYVRHEVVHNRFVVDDLKDTPRSKAPWGNGTERTAAGKSIWSKTLAAWQC